MLLTALFIAAVFWNLHIAPRIDFKYIRLISYACWQIIKYYFTILSAIDWSLFLSNQYADLRKKVNVTVMLKNDLNVGDRREWERDLEMFFFLRSKLKMWLMNIFEIHVLVDFSKGILMKTLVECILRWKISIVKNKKSTKNIVYSTPYQQLM